MATVQVALDHPLPDSQLETRVTAVQEAIKRSRFALFLCVFSAGAVVVCLWNTYISSDRDLAFAALPYQVSSLPAGVDPGGKDSGNPSFRMDRIKAYELLMGQQYRAWIDSQFIAVNLLGIRISVSDFDVFAGLALTFFLYYFLLCCRRENREIGQLYRDLYRGATTNGVFDPRRLQQASYNIYHAISSYMIFNLNTRDDSPIRNLSGKLEPKRLPGLRMFYHAMTFSTVIALAFVVICDIGSDFLEPATSTFFKSPFRWTLGSVAANSTPDRVVYLMVLDMIGACFCILALAMTIRVRHYQDATRSVMEDFRDRLSEAGYIEGSEGAD